MIGRLDEVATARLGAHRLRAGDGFGVFADPAGHRGQASRRDTGNLTEITSVSEPTRLVRIDPHCARGSDGCGSRPRPAAEYAFPSSESEAGSSSPARRPRL